jgi:hypothetical protein
MEAFVLHIPRAVKERYFLTGVGNKRARFIPSYRRARLQVLQI